MAPESVLLQFPIEDHLVELTQIEHCERFAQQSGLVNVRGLPEAQVLDR